MLPRPTEPNESTRASGDVSAAVHRFRRCFNDGEFFEAHEVLEGIWLPVRRTPEGDLWQGLIQLAAAFVHGQRGRRGPALSLLVSARRRLTAATGRYPGVDVPAAVQLANEWIRIAEHTPESELPGLLDKAPPHL